MSFFHFSCQGRVRRKSARLNPHLIHLFYHTPKAQATKKRTDVRFHIAGGRVSEAVTNRKVAVRTGEEVPTCISAVVLGSFSYRG